MPPSMPPLKQPSTGVKPSHLPQQCAAWSISHQNALSRIVISGARGMPDARLPRSESEPPFRTVVSLSLATGPGAQNVSPVPVTPLSVRSCSQSKWGNSDSCAPRCTYRDPQPTKYPAAAGFFVGSDARQLVFLPRRNPSPASPKTSRASDPGSPSINSSGPPTVRCTGASMVVAGLRCTNQP